MNSLNSKSGFYVLSALALCWGLLFSPAAAGAAGFDGQKAFSWIEKQCGLGPRNPGSPGHQAALKMLKDELSSRGAEVVLQPFMHYDQEKAVTLTMNNIVASFFPENKNRIMLCAHWDTRPFADQEKGEKANIPILGANDGASGVAVLLEISRIIQQKKPPVGIDIVLFDGEDYGREGHLENYCLGSQYFAENNSKYYPQFAILLDMVGDANLEIPIEGYSYQFAPRVVDRVWRAAQELGAYEFVPVVQGYVYDDHIPLNQAGIPAIDIIDFAYPDNSHRYWHTLEDTPDKCSAASLQVVGDVVLKVIYEMLP
ncbi:MAG: M28 family peptidase [Calditrichia bacterium]